MTAVFAVLLVAVAIVAAFHAAARGRAVRCIVTTLAMLVLGWMLTAIFFLMPTQGWSGNERLWPMVLFYLVAFPVLFGILGMTAMALGGVEQDARGVGLAGILGGSVLGALLTSLAMVDVQASDLPAPEVDGVLGWIRGALSTVEDMTGAEPFWLLATSAILVPWVVGMGAAALRARGVRGRSPDDRDS